MELVNLRSWILLFLICLAIPLVGCNSLGVFNDNTGSLHIVVANAGESSYYSNVSFVNESGETVYTKNHSLEPEQSIEYNKSFRAGEYQLNIITPSGNLSKEIAVSAGCNYPTLGINVNRESQEAPLVIFHGCS